METTDNQHKNCENHEDFCAKEDCGCKYTPKSTLLDPKQTPGFTIDLRDLEAISDILPLYLGKTMYRKEKRFKRSKIRTLLTCLSQLNLKTPKLKKWYFRRKDVYLVKSGSKLLFVPFGDWFVSDKFFFNIHTTISSFFKGVSTPIISVKKEDFLKHHSNNGNTFKGFPKYHPFQLDDTGYIKWKETTEDPKINYFEIPRIIEYDDTDKESPVSEYRCDKCGQLYYANPNKSIPECHQVIRGDDVDVLCMGKLVAQVQKPTPSFSSLDIRPKDSNNLLCRCSSCGKRYILKPGEILHSCTAYSSYNEDGVCGGNLGLV